MDKQLKILHKLSYYSNFKQYEFNMKILFEFVNLQNRPTISQRFYPPLFFNGAEQPHYFCKGQNGIEIMCVLFCVSPLCIQFKKGGLYSKSGWTNFEYNWPLCTNWESHHIRELNK